MRRVLLSMLMLPSLAVAGPIADLLDGALATCDEKRKDYGENARHDFTKVREPNNGYARIRGGYDACGDGCGITAAVFSASDGTYRVLSYETRGYTLLHRLNGDDWARVLPTDFRHQLAPELKDYAGPAVFYVKPTLPQHGTDLVLNLELLPAGVAMTCPYGICYASSIELADEWVEDVDRPTEAEAAGVAARAEPRWAAYNKTRWGEVVLRWDRDKAMFRMKKATAPAVLTREAFDLASHKWTGPC